ncbi:primase alpha helix C-terminal domain-containing protein [Streptococcus fryi]
MSIYETRGFNNVLHLYTGKLSPFDYIANFKPVLVPSGVDIEHFKRTTAPNCLSGQVIPSSHGTYKRNNDSLVYRDLIFLDYDNLETSSDLPKIVSKALDGYSYVLYPTINHTPKNPRFRLVIKPSQIMDMTTYKTVVTEIAEKIGLPFDTSSLTWSQLQGLPITRHGERDYQKIVNYGKDYPIRTVKPNQNKRAFKPNNQRKSITMRVLDTLLNGYGNEGGRNVAVTQFVGLLLNRYVNCDVSTAYELTQIANNVTPKPLPQKELDAIFRSIVRAEIRKRGENY